MLQIQAWLHKLLERGDGVPRKWRQREEMGERDPPSLFNSSLHFLLLSSYRETLTTSPLSLPLLPLFLSVMNLSPIYGICREYLKSQTYAFRGNNSE